MGFGTSCTRAFVIQSRSSDMSESVRISVDRLAMSQTSCRRPRLRNQKSSQWNVQDWRRCIRSGAQPDHQVWLPATSLFLKLSSEAEEFQFWRSGGDSLWITDGAWGTKWNFQMFQEWRELWETVYPCTQGLLWRGKIHQVRLLSFKGAVLELFDRTWSLFSAAECDWTVLMTLSV